MADAAHVHILLKEGIRAWNDFRTRSPVPVHPDFSGADLCEADLAGANLDYADLNGAVLAKANLYRAGLFTAKLAEADLRGADLRRANLELANLSGAKFRATRLENTNLRFARGLESCQHSAPSSINYWPVHTLSDSGAVPISFLRGCGLTSDFIDYLLSLRHDPVQSYSCFVAHSAADKSFAYHFADALRDLGVRCWVEERPGQRADADPLLQSGAKRLWDKEILCCSVHSFASSWMLTDITAAIEGERDGEALALLPIDLDGSLYSRKRPLSDLNTYGYQFQIGGIQWRTKVQFDFAGGDHETDEFHHQVAKIAKLIHAPLHPMPGAAAKQRPRRKGSESQREAVDRTLRSGPAVSRIEETPHFTVYHPSCLAKNEASSLLAYVHLESVTRQVFDDAQLKLSGGSAPKFKKEACLATRYIRRGANVTVAPYLPACRITPRVATFCWSNNWHCAEFTMTQEVGANAGHVQGSVEFYVGPIMVGSVPLLVEFTPLESGRRTAQASANPYDAVFVSYSHQDSQIVDELTAAYTVLGFEYLRDVQDLRAGDKWNDALFRLIDRADIFQLCWSQAAACSRYVEREWRYARNLQRIRFIRPVFWEQPMPTPPEELRDTHFAYFELGSRLSTLRQTSTGSSEAPLTTKSHWWGRILSFGRR